MNTSLRSKTARIVPLLLSLLILGAGCASITDESANLEPVEDLAETTACVPDGSVTDFEKLVVGESTGVISEPYIAWGVQERCFEKYGVEIESVAGSSQAARTAGLVGGSLDVAAQHVRFITQTMANGEFNPLFISAHYGVSQDALNQAQNATTFNGELLFESALIAGQDSGISDWRDLDRKQIGVINVTSVDAKGLSNVSDEVNLNFNSLTLVQLDQQEILNGLLRGDLDAGVISGSLALEAINNGGTLIGYPGAFFVEPGVLLLWVANADVSDPKIEALSRFQKALWEIYSHLEDPDYQEDLLDLMEKKYELEPATRAAIRLPDLMPRQVTPEDFEGWIPKMIEFGDIDSDVAFTDSMFLKR